MQDLWINSLLFLGQLRDKKTCAFIVMRIGKRVVWGWRKDGQMSLGRQCPFCWCVSVCGAEGGLGGHNQASNIALAAKY